jgi:ATP-binding cassette subfamily C exporter for protease/lipase
MILRFPQGYDTRVGDAGSGLSGGQKQRIGLARALYGLPPFLVLDEPNSNLDDVGEQALSQAIMQLRQMGKTVILISHRPNIIRVTNKLLMLRDGMVAAFGPTEQVLKAMAEAQNQAAQQAKQQTELASPAPQVEADQAAKPDADAGSNAQDPNAPTQS